MPKKINHEEYRLQLAQKAAVLFSKHGFNGLGMRQVAAELGLSKSALYHYFPTKQALFHACTDLVTKLESDPKEALSNIDISDPKSAIPQLISQIKAIEPSFHSELSLLVDYMRGRTSKDIAADPSMQLANERYRELVARHVGDEQASPVLCLMMGTLLMRYFDGEETNFNAIEEWLIERAQT